VVTHTFSAAFLRAKILSPFLIMSYCSKSRSALESSIYSVSMGKYLSNAEPWSCMPSSSMRKLGVCLATLPSAHDVRQASGVVFMFGFSRGVTRVIVHGHRVEQSYEAVLGC
jgi:hypothetical protein